MQPDAPTLFKLPKPTPPTAEDLEAKLAKLQKAFKDEIDNGDEAEDTLHDMETKIADVKYTLWKLDNPGPLRCESCGRFLKGTPTEHLFTPGGHNLDEYDCDSCGVTLEVCY